MLRNSVDNLDFSLTTRIKERIEYRKDNSSPSFCNGELNELKAWKNRKSLISDETFNLKLKYEKISEEAFNLGISKLQNDDKKKILEIVKEKEWFKNFEDIMSCLREVELKSKATDFTYAVRAFLFWAKDQFEKKLDSDNLMSSSAIEMLLEDLNTELLNIAGKTLVRDLHLFKNKGSLMGENSSERFCSYLNIRFKYINDMVGFFREYPTLAKLLTIRTMFFVNNLNEFLSRYLDELSLIKEVFGHHNNKNEITSIKMSAGDSHDNGRTVILFELDNKLRLVYKPKDLQVVKTYYQFLQWINKKNRSFNFYIPKQIIKDKYAFEEYIQYKDCSNIDEIKSFYKRFGHLIGITHFLCGNDFHYENVIAFGGFPIIIDLETLFQHVPSLKMGDDAYTSLKFEHVNSVNYTGLVPFTAYDERANNKKGVELSALSGDEQIAPFKVLKVANENSDEMVFKYQDLIINGANNIPKINGEKADFKKFIPYIFDGFKEISNFFMENKKELITDGGMLEGFKGKKVRNVLKSTQRYVDMLSFSYHPNCTKDYIEREKLFENLWAYPHSNKEVILYEIEDMCKGDVPVFYNIVNSKDIITSNGTIIKDYYDKTAYDRVIERIRSLNEEEIEKQLSYMKVSFGMYTNKSYRLNLNLTDLKERVNVKDIIIDKDFLLNEALNIADQLTKEMYVSEDDETVSWSDVNLDQKGTWSIGPINADLYDGLSGLLLFYSSLYKVTADPKLRDVYLKIENSIYHQVVNKNELSSFAGRGALLYPLTILMLNTGYSSYQKKINGIVKYLEQNIENCVQHDWIGGYAGILKNLVNIYKITKDLNVKHFAEELGERIDLNTVNLGGFAHGFAGVASSLFALSDISEKKTFFDKAVKSLEKDQSYFDSSKSGWKDKRFNNEQISHKWCHGSTGIGINRINSLKYLENNNTLKKEIDICYDNLTRHTKNDDCLCHGNFGDIEFLLSYFLLTKDRNIYNSLIYKLRNVLENKYKYGDYLVRSIPCFRSVGLFTGISGIGYEFLRLYNPEEIPSLLHFDI
ncbi:type 2 lanthipeptide synthetase LanM family protein [Bacillus sonorensis]|uniref:type 2 lanthipeptide synthetase LanM family protein n=1 Tax=Bacillus sonorensis TaxID=119858 RepID=UPI000494FF12|nr:type 2 lanthipeptide synthetase LanM family protein [Bacillus sonorensis]MCY8090033.1 type 2 lantipeptide synthetase LanM family protein [Bacillus sonorensis]MCZ0067077.1 type 2 lanthipeptide synthetase LanM family protein [Bacillus sonorensis]MCZ0095607.1 type 2 lanthipeptide synthetase LanM family protein [Bacillus sonorensis]MEC1354943.1 type 2 lanthipeptide synthetase LanM family protein [Bacillus sonorensis]MEC1427145.1 type 2 lanthipeptide synthetase LanM family protein [Bacillus sono